MVAVTTIPALLNVSPVKYEVFVGAWVTAILER
ncbi:MAG: hypothetical protein [Bacteriophage sp.]|nr:MAG: hypothetical protein [Bacteriophage sp.]